MIPSLSANVGIEFSVEGRAGAGFGVRWGGWDFRVPVARFGCILDPVGPRAVTGPGHYDGTTGFVLRGSPVSVPTATPAHICQIWAGRQEPCQFHRYLVPRNVGHTDRPIDTGL